MFPRRTEAVGNHFQTNFAKSLKLGGGMVWSIETDDFQGKCHGKKYPLLSAINEVFAEPGVKPLPVPPPPPPTPSTVSPTTPGGGSTASTASTPMTWWPTQSSSPTNTPWWTPESTTQTPSTTPSTTTSTTARPTTSAPKPDGSTPSSLPCDGEGLRPIPGDCQKFYSCVAFGQGYMQYEYSCPTGTVFDPINKSCTWPEYVPGCQFHQLKKYSFLWPYYSYKGDYKK